MTTLSEAIKDYQLCPGRQIMTRLGVCDRRTGCPNTCKGKPAATTAPPSQVITNAQCRRDTGKGAKRREGAIPGPRGPNKTEMEYRYRHIPVSIDGSPCVILFEGITFKLRAGFRYTPDWIVVRPDGTLEAHEAKGPWQSRDAHLRWAQAAQEWPAVRFFWGKRDKNGQWKMEERNT